MKFKRKLKSSIQKNYYDLIYSNSVKSAEILMALTDNTALPVIQHVHELEQMIQNFLQTMEQQ